MGGFAIRALFHQLLKLRTYFVMIFRENSKYSYFNTAIGVNTRWIIVLGAFGSHKWLLIPNIIATFPPLHILLSDNGVPGIVYPVTFLDCYFATRCTTYLRRAWRPTIEEIRIFICASTCSVITVLYVPPFTGACIPIGWKMLLGISHLIIPGATSFRRCMYL